jgi:hypothetical protein
MFSKEKNEFAVGILHFAVKVVYIFIGNKIWMHQ